MDADQPQQLSPSEVPLLASYDLEALNRPGTRPLCWAPRQPVALHELLPVRDPAQVITPGEGFTLCCPCPLFSANRSAFGSLDEG